MSCGHCTETVRKALEAVSGVISADVTLESANVYGKADIQTLIAAVEQAAITPHSKVSTPQN
ncbi:hypothetical protein A8M56_20345 [Yersinia pestis]|nr:hypothetical protein A8M56_20345 [Yersinia pestis]